MGHDCQRRCRLAIGTVCVCLGGWGSKCPRGLHRLVEVRCLSKEGDHLGWSRVDGRKRWVGGGGQGFLGMCKG